MILSVLAQVIIDGCKREYEVDALSEIERIKKMPCMNPTLHDEKKDYPFFIKYVKNISVSPKGKDVPYEEIRDKKAKINDRINPKLVCPCLLYTSILCHFKIVLVEAPLQFFRQIGIAFPSDIAFLHLISGKSVLIQKNFSVLGFRRRLIFDQVPLYIFADPKAISTEAFHVGTALFPVNGPDNHHSVYHLFCKDQRRNRVILKDIRYEVSPHHIAPLFGFSLQRMIQTDGICLLYTSRCV